MMSRITSVSVMAAGVSLGAMAQSGESTLMSPKPPDYPRVNLATAYEVDRDWPRRPSGIHWGAVSGIAVDARDNVWIYTRTNPTVQVYAPDGRYLFGWPKDQTKSIAHFLRIDREGNVWLADVGLHVVRKFSPQGHPLLTLGQVGEPGEDARHLHEPTDMTFGLNGDIFVADGYGNNRVMHFDRRGKFIKSWGTLGTAPSQFSIPHSIQCDSKGWIYVADRNNVRIQVFNTRGRLLDVWPNILVPWGIWISPGDEIWVCGSSPMQWNTDAQTRHLPLGCPPKDQLFVKFSPAGRVLGLWTLPKGEDGATRPGEVNWLHTIALDSQGNVYLGDIMGRRVQKFAPRIQP